METKFWHISQNNSGGYFIDNDEVCEDLIIEATNAEEAEEILQGIVEGYTEYCSCCGERWGAWWDDDDGEDVPCIYGDPIEKCEKSMFHKKVYIYRYGSDKPEVAYLE